MAGMEGRRVGKMHAVFALPTTNVLYLRYLLGRAAVVMTWCDWSRMVHDRQLINDAEGEIPGRFCTMNVVAGASATPRFWDLTGSLST